MNTNGTVISWLLLLAGVFGVDAAQLYATEIPSEIKAVQARLDAARSAAEKEMYEAKIKANEEAIKDLEKLLKAERKKDIPLLTVELDQRMQALTQEMAELRDDKMIRAKAIAQRVRFKEYTAEEWESVVSPVFTVSATEARNATKLTILAGQVFLIVPHPADRWQSSGGASPCDWKGDVEGGMRLMSYSGDKSSDNLFITEPGVLTLGGVDTDFHDNKGNLRVKLIRVR